MIEFDKLLVALSGVDYVLVGGVAAYALGAARITQDLDIVYRRTPENISALVKAVAPLNPYPRGAPAGLPFMFDERTVRNGLNFTLKTALGDLGLLGEVAGMTTYEELHRSSTTIGAFGVPVRCVNLDRLIQLKRAAGRPKDYEAIAELEALLEEQSS